MKPLELKDFSGGETDNVFQGDAIRAEKLTNLLIGINHKATSRQGSLVKDNPPKAERINYIQNFNSYTDLVYASEGSFYDIDGNEIVGPDGNSAFVGSSPEAMYTSAEIQGHLILANDEVFPPQKIYRDEDGDLQVRTVGLPKVERPRISDADLLDECITAANLLRTRFLNHINSAENLNSERDGVSANYLLTTMQPPSSTNAHWSVDKYAKYYFDGAVTFTAGQWRPNGVPDATPNPTPAGAATDFDSLVALAEALSLAFEEHRQDSAGFAAIDNTTSTSFTFGPLRYHAIGYQSQWTDFVNNYGFAQSVGGYINAIVKPVNQGIQQQITKSWNPDNAVNASTPNNEVVRTKLIAIARFLDDFAVKFALHETAPFVHRYNFQNNQQTNALVAAAFAHQFLEPLLKDSPVIIATPFNFIYAANYVSRAFDNHALNTDLGSDLSPTFPTKHTLANDTIVSGLRKSGYYFATLPPNPDYREQYTAFYWDVILAKLAIYAARYSYFVHSIDLLYGFETSRINQDASAGGPPWTAHLTINPSGVDWTTGQLGMCIIARYGQQVSNTNKKLSFNGIIANSGAGNYTLALSANGFTYTNESVGTFVMHPYPLATNNTSFPNFNQDTQYLGSFGYAPDIYDLASWIDLMKSFYVAFKAHLIDPDVHYHTELSHLEFFPEGESLGPNITAGSLIAGLTYRVTVPGTGNFANVGGPNPATLNAEWVATASAVPTSWGGATVVTVSSLPAGGVQYFPLSQLLPSVNLPNTVPKFFLPNTSNEGPQAVSYGYAFTYSDTYTVEGGVTYRVESAPVFSEPVFSEETMAIGFTMPMFDETTVFITNQLITPVAMILEAPPLVNDSETNYTVPALLNTYRTAGNGETFSLVKLIDATPLEQPAVPWPTINLLGQYDLVADRFSIDGNEALDDAIAGEANLLYTTGGFSASSQPPKSKYTWIANDYVYYGGVYDGDTFVPNRVLQSNQLAPDWVPSQNYVEFSSPVVGGGSARNVNVCMTETGVFRLEGAFGTDGSGAIVKQQISNQIGGISGSSIVVTEVGLFFAATNGFYYTDGYQCIRISQERVNAFKNATVLPSQRRAIKGVYDRENRRVFWSIRSTSTELDNDKIFSYDLNFGITPSGTFTTLIGATGSWNPSALGFLGNTLYIGDTDGYLYYLDENTKTDPLKDLLVDSDDWTTTYIPWEYRSTMMDFGGTAMRKFFSRIHHVGKNLGDVAIQYYITADNLVTQNLAPMRFIDNAGLGAVDQWRRVGGKKLRADLYQVGCRNGRFTVYNSDTLGGTPTFTSHALTQTTLTMLNTVIPTDSVGMSICFETDYYETEFEIVNVIPSGPDTILVVEDPLNEANSLLALGWEIRGFMKEQAFALDALTIWFEEQGNLGSQYRGYSSPEGGGGNV